MSTKSKIVCLCGSMNKAIEEFKKQEYEITLRGDVALMPCCMTVDIQREYGADSDYKIKADENHKKKIEICDEVLVLNVNGYIGESTTLEIIYATMVGKSVTYLEPNSEDMFLKSLLIRYNDIVRRMQNGLSLPEHTSMISNIVVDYGNLKNKQADNKISAWIQFSSTDYPISDKPGTDRYGQDRIYKFKGQPCIGFFKTGILNKIEFFYITDNGFGFLDADEFHFITSLKY